MSSLANELCAFYCLSYKNEERKTALARRFSQLNINVEFYDGVGFDDPRLNILTENNSGSKRPWSCMYGHLDMINKFLNETDKEYGVFCEDDIYLDKNLANDIPTIVEDFKTMELDVLLLSYLTPYKIEGYYHGFSIKQYFSNRSRRYHDYPYDLWGAQMYMLSRSHAKQLLEKYYNGYAEKSLNYAGEFNQGRNTPPFSSDWTITKDGNRAIVYPMYAVEDGKTVYDHEGQRNFHERCFYHNYNPEQFI
jgi:GR25 family glycosyltransferase involved in LPS biosynthesis